MKQLFIIIIAIGLFVGGCAQNKKVFYASEYTTQERFEADKEFCRDAAKLIAQKETSNYNEQVIIWKNMFEGCMTSKGYELEKGG